MNLKIFGKDEEFPMGRVFGFASIYEKTNYLLYIFK